MLNRKDIQWYVLVAVFVWVFTVFAAGVFQLMHNHQELALTKLAHSCPFEVPSG